MEIEMVKTMLVKVAMFIVVTLVENVLPELATSKRNRSDLDHHANQKNPNNPAHTAARNNRSNQLNPNNQAYQKSRANNQR